MRIALLTLVAVTSSLAQTADDARMNQIQTLGSHNSYKEAISPSLFRLIDEKRPGRLDGLDYSHWSLDKQLDHGLRKLEIDVVHDPEGGRYARPFGLELVKRAGLPPGPPYDPDGKMMQPGLKVLHVTDIDFRTSVYTFREALELLERWSDAHPRHLPIAILMNAKTGGIADPGYTPGLEFDAAAFDAWDAEIRAVMGPEDLITPDDVRGGHPTLEAAALANGWPTLGAARGKFLFVLDQRDEKMETYVAGHPSLAGRVMFVNATEGRPEAAFRIVNNPVKEFNYIQRLVRAGYLVRTRADSDTREARSGDTTRREKAFASGAHFISTDYYVEDERFGTGYKVELPGGGTGRWNPVLAPDVRPLPGLE